MLADCSWLREPYQAFSNNDQVDYEPIIVAETTSCPKASIIPWLGQAPTGSGFPIYFPKSHFNGGATDIIIVLNGWLERKLDSLKLYESEKWSLASLLCSPPVQHQSMRNRSINCVFLPLPYHYWRLPVEGKAPKVEPAFCVYRQPELLFHSFCNIFDDIHNAIEAIIAYLLENYQYDASQCRFHLLGYSLGGLAALGVFLGQMKSSSRLSSCHLLASGIPLAAIDDIALHHEKANTHATFMNNTGFQTSRLRMLISKVVDPDLIDSQKSQIIDTGNEVTKLLFDIYRYFILGLCNGDLFDAKNVALDDLSMLHYYCATKDALFSSKNVKTYSLFDFDNVKGAFLKEFDWNNHILVDRDEMAGWHSNGSAKEVAGSIREAILSTDLPLLTAPSASSASSPPA